MSEEKKKEAIEEYRDARDDAERKATEVDDAAILAIDAIEAKHVANVAHDESVTRLMESVRALSAMGIKITDIEEEPGA